MTDYYSGKLFADKLRRCYEIAPRRVQQYLQAEIALVLRFTHSHHHVLELGCDYGRVLKSLAEKVRLVVGIDTSMGSLKAARDYLADCGSGYCLACMDAATLAFSDDSFELVVCIQNGISVFHVDQHQLIGESLRVLRPGGTALFSSYAGGFWESRLEWFELQSSEGLLGEIDYDQTGDGTVVCKDGFTATTFGAEEFRKLASGFDVDCDTIEVDGSALFCDLRSRV